MSQTLIAGSHVTLPSIRVNSGSSSPSSILNATGKIVHYIGNIILENPLGGSKTISAAGGGSIVWRSGAVTFANAGSTFKVGIQDVSTSTAPAQGDGTFDVEASFTGGGGGVTSSATQTSTMTSGTKTIAHGDLISITFSMTARAGADSVVVTHNLQRNFYDNQITPAVVDNTGGSYARLATSNPNAYIVFDDGSVGWIYGFSFNSTTPILQTFNSGTATADEYGNLIYYPCTFYALGIGFYGNITNASSDFELLLYTTPLGTPSAVKTITVDATQISATVTDGNFFYLFPTPYTLLANTQYGITIRPTTTNNVSIYYQDTNSSTGGKTGIPNTNAYAIRRLDNTGAFSDYNGGTAKTRKMAIYLLGSSIEQGVNMCSGQVGVY